MSLPIRLVPSLLAVSSFFSSSGPSARWFGIKNRAGRPAALDAVGPAAVAPRPAPAQRAIMLNRPERKLNHVINFQKNLPTECFQWEFSIWPSPLGDLQCKSSTWPSPLWVLQCKSSSWLSPLWVLQCRLDDSHCIFYSGFFLFQYFH